MIKWIVIGVILILIFESNRVISAKKFIVDVQPYFSFLMEKDYTFLLSVKYKENLDVEKLFGQRVRNGLVAIVAVFLIMLSQMSFIYFLLSIGVGFLIFKLPYLKLKSFYRANLYNINLMLPYYLKSLEILIQHYTVPVALAKSVESAPEVFKDGLKKLVIKIEGGDSTIEPYMDFAREYPVRDSMRMMRLLYRLSLGSQENKHEQIVMFSKTISSLQNKSREQKYKDRLDKMEKKTMLMLAGTGGGIILLLLVSMFMMMNI